MKKIAILVGISAGIIYILLREKKSQAMSRPPIPANITAQNIGQAGVVPEGYKLASKVPNSVTQKCLQLLGLSSGYNTMAYGYEEYATFDEKDYFFRIEPHYHPPGYVGGPTGWHKGCTVYEKI